MRMAPRRGGRRGDGAVANASLFVRARERPETFGDVFREYHAPVLRFMARRTLDPEVATDLMAETFAQMLANLSKFRGTTEDAGRDWMWTIARNQLVDWHRRGHVERRYLERVGVEHKTLDADEYARIEELADIAGLRELVRAALHRLKPEQRRVIELRVVEERSYDEIAEILNTSLGGARQRLSKALRELAGIVNAPSPDDGPHADPKELLT
jgi:RNA polymerase sigma factor (sigma-70 family)